MTTWSNALFHPPTKNPDIIGGQVHGTYVAAYSGQIPVYNAKY